MDLQSDVAATQNAYWEKFYPWYTEEAPAAIKSLRRRLSAYFEGIVYARNSLAIYPPNTRNMDPNVAEVCRQYNTLNRWCAAFSKSRDILPQLNPTGRNARKLVTGGWVVDPIPAIISDQAGIGRINLCREWSGVSCWWDSWNVGARRGVSSHSLVVLYFALIFSSKKGTMLPE